MEPNDKPTPQATGIVLNWGVILNVFAAMLQYLLITLPTLQGSMPPVMFVVSTLTVGLLNIGWISFKQSQVNTLVAENQTLKSQQ